MRVWFRHVWGIVSASYWFIPTTMVLAAAVLALGVLAVDQRIDGLGLENNWLYGGGSEGARTLLSTIGGSVITVAGVVFSITISALTQASQQFGPRLLRNFMSDRGNQIVLGTFTATFLYSLLVLRAIRGEFEEGSTFVPHASVTVAVLLAIASIAVLIYFIHHVSMSLQAPVVVAAVLDDLEAVIEQMPEDEDGSAVSLPSMSIPPLSEDQAAAVETDHSGYIQAIDYEALLKKATEHDLTLKLDYRPGDYVVAGTTLLRAWPTGRVDAAIKKSLCNEFYYGRHRTPEQDIEYAIRQMVEVAVRALSPGVNDPFTAMNCLDGLGNAICQIAGRGLPGPLRYDDGGALRLTVAVTTFDGVVDAAFNQIRQYGRDSVAVTIRLLEVLTTAGPMMRHEAQRRSLLRQAQMTYRQSESAIPDAADRADVQQRWEKAARVLGA